MQDICEYLGKKLHSAYTNKKTEVLDTINTEIVRRFLFGEKYKLIHDFDPPWDCSGTLVKINKKFNLHDYKKVGNFLEEYNGNMKATYMSGLGFVPETFEEDVEYLINDEIKKLLEQVVQELESVEMQELRRVLKETAGEEIDNDDDIAEAILFADLIGEEVIELSETILEDVKEQPFKEVVEKYKDRATKNEEEYLTRLREEMERKKREKAEAIATWEKIKRLYKRFFGKDVPEKIEKGVEYGKLKNLLDVTDEIPEEDIRKVGKYLSSQFSNSVDSELAEYVRKTKFERLYFNKGNNNILVLCDPIYFNTEHQLVVDNIARGMWYVSTDTFKDEYGVYVSKILLLHESCINTGLAIDPAGINTLLGNVDIDTATLGIYFGGIFEERPDNFLTTVVLRNSVYTKTGFGDGTYTVCGKRNRKNKVVAIKINFV